MTRSLAKLFLLVAAVAVAAGLGVGLTQLYAGTADAFRVSFEIVNQTDRTVDVSYFYAGTDHAVAKGIAPGQQAEVDGLLTDAPSCTDGDLIARDAQGTEVARQSEPVCNHQMWVITNGATPAH
jgi:hypothetical protein